MRTPVCLYIVRVVLCVILHGWWPGVVTTPATAAGNEINTNIFHMEMLYHCRSLAGEMANRMANIGLTFAYMFVRMPKSNRCTAEEQTDLHWQRVYRSVHATSW